MGGVRGFQLRLKNYFNFCVTIPPHMETRGNKLSTIPAEECFDLSDVTLVTSSTPNSERTQLRFQSSGAVGVCKSLRIVDGKYSCSNPNEAGKDRGSTCGSAEYIAPKE